MTIQELGYAEITLTQKASKILGKQGSPSFSFLLAAFFILDNLIGSKYCKDPQTRKKTYRAGGHLINLSLASTILSASRGRKL